MADERIENRSRSKLELRERLYFAYQRLVKELTEIKERDSRLQELEGQVSVCDILAYQIGWGQLLIGWESAERQGETPSMPAKGYKWNQLGELAQFFYHTYYTLSLKELENEFEKTVKLILQWIDTISEEEIWLLNQRR